MGNFLPKNPDMDGYGSGRTGWSGVGLRILPREGLLIITEKNSYNRQEVHETIGP